MATVVPRLADNHVVTMHGIHYKVSVNSQHEGIVQSFYGKKGVNLKLIATQWFPEFLAQKNVP